MTQGWKIKNFAGDANGFRVVVIRKLDKVDDNVGKDISKGFNNMLFAYTDNPTIVYHNTNPGSSHSKIRLDLTEGISERLLKRKFLATTNPAMKNLVLLKQLNCI